VEVLCFIPLAQIAALDVVTDQLVIIGREGGAQVL
jgi:hypothetical protein